MSATISSTPIPSLYAPVAHRDHTLHYLALGGLLVAGAVILSPYVLPLVGIGTSERALEAMTALHGDGLGTGLAGLINRGIDSIPLIGSAIANNTLISAATSATLGIGGLMLARAMEKTEDGLSSFKWSKVVRYGAMMTSALVALPSILSGISIGIVYLSYACSGVKLASAAALFFNKTLGSSGMIDGAAAGIGGLSVGVSHLLTCGGALLPALAATVIGGLDGDDQAAATVRVAEVKITQNLPTAEGTLCQAKLTLSHADGSALSEGELAVVHTKKIHLFVVDSTLKDYQHIHPEPTAEPGVFAFSFTPKTNNRYSAWADFTLLKNNQNLRLKTDLASSTGRDIAPRIRASNSAELAGLQIDWNSREPLRENSASMVDIELRDATGKPVMDLEPVMGAYAHLVGFSADGKSIIHTHPMGPEPTSETDRGGPHLRFHVEPNCSGPTQFYFQIKRGGEDLYVPFGQHILPPEKHAERNYAPAAIAHAHH